MSDALVRVKEHLSTLNPAERAAAEYILGNPAEAARISITQRLLRLLPEILRAVRPTPVPRLTRAPC